MIAFDLTVTGTFSRSDLRAWERGIGASLGRRSRGRGRRSAGERRRRLAPLVWPSSRESFVPPRGLFADLNPSN